MASSYLIGYGDRAGTFWAAYRYSVYFTPCNQRSEKLRYKTELYVFRGYDSKSMDKRDFDSDIVGVGGWGHFWT